MECHYWKNTVIKRCTNFTRRIPVDADVGVIGIGTMGSMAVWQLARNEISVIGFEQFGIGHSRSSGGGETRLFRTAYKEGPEYVPLLHESLYQWRQLEKESGRELLTLNGGLTIGDPESDFIKISLKSTQQYSLDHEILDNQQAKDRYPQHYLLPNEIMVLDKMAGFIRPEWSQQFNVQNRMVPLYIDILEWKKFSHMIVEC